MITHTLIAPELIPRLWAAIVGAVAIAVVGLAGTETAFYNPGRGIDWNVVFLLLGDDGDRQWPAPDRSVGIPRGVVCAGLRWTTVPTQGTAHRGDRHGVRLLDNVTTVLLVAPVVPQVCRHLGLSSAPYLISIVCASNIGGTATLIGDPPTIMIASRSGLTFNDFPVNLAHVSSCLREVTHQALGRGVVLLGQQPNVVAQVEQSLEHLARVVSTPHQGIVLR
jgi:Citrate transporter